MYYFVTAKSESGLVASKFGYAKTDSTLPKRVRNAQRLLAANGYATLVETQSGPADKLVEGQVQRALRAKLGRPATGTHADVAGECYIGAGVSDCIAALGEAGFGYVAEFQAKYKHRNAEEKNFVWLALAEQTQKELYSAQEAVVAHRKRFPYAQWTGILLLILAIPGLVVVLASGVASDENQKFAYIGGAVVLAILGLGALSAGASNRHEQRQSLEQSVHRLQSEWNNLEALRIYHKWTPLEHLSTAEGSNRANVEGS